MFLVTSKKPYTIARIVLGLIFISSGSLKLLDLESFARVIEAFGLVPYGSGPVLAGVITLAEIISGMGLVADVRGSLTAILGMLLMFIAVLSHAVFMGYDIDCGCFGPNDPEANAFSGLRTALVRDFIMVAQVTYLYFWRFKNHHRPLSIHSNQKQEELKK